MKGATLFKKWFGASKVRETTTTPLAVYHGTTHDFPSFTVERANPENYWGSGFYFTTSAEDAGDNYAGEGPDLTQRIDTMAEKIADRLEDAAEEAITVAQRRQFFEKGREEARKILKGSHGGAILPVYLKIVKPLVLGAPYGLNSVGSLKETVWSPEKAAEFGQYVLEEAGAFDDAKDFFASDFEEFIADSERRAEDVIETLKNDESITYATDENGLLMTSEILGRAIRRMGYDGIIDRAVAKRFPRMGLAYDDAHFIVWTPEQIKSVFNRGTWNPKDPVISNGDKARMARCGGRTVRYGAKGAKVMPGTPKGDAYCARSLGQMRDHPAAAKDPCSPLRLSRKRWACKGGVSVKKNPPDSSIATVHNPDSLIAPNPTPFGEVIFDDEDEIVLDEPKRNAPRKRKTAKSENEGVGLLAKINNAALFLSPAMLAADPVKGLAGLRQAVAAYIPKASTKTWKNAATKFLWWLDEGCPFTGSESFKTANKMVKPELVDKLVENDDGVKELKKVKVKRTVFSVYGRGNSKLPYVTFSTLPGITCPGAGVCLTNTEEFPGDENKERKHKGGWCYSFKAWRYPAAYFRQLGNTLMVKMPRGRQELARLFGLWAEQEAIIKGGETIRLYVDGDIDSETTLEFWMNLCDRHPHVRAYGYSKSWTIFLSYGERLATTKKEWPSNYTLNLSEGSKFWNNEKTHSRIMQLPITRHDFGVVKIEKDDGKKIPQNVIDLDGKETGVYPAIARLEKRVNATAPGDERDRLQEELDDWKKTAALLETTRGAAISQDDDGGDDKPKAYIEIKYVENGVEKTERKAISVPDEFWSRNPEYTKAVSIAARKAVNADGTPKYPQKHYTRADGKPGTMDSFFVCPGKCGNCLGNGRHACGEINLEKAIVIGLH